MELSSEDALRLHVLLASGPQAIRIDEANLVVYALGPQGEARVRLNPTLRPDRYVRLVRELISGQVLGSPGGYPVYLQRWTRMGQMRGERLAQLLLLGEPEAVVAAVCSPGLTDELARLAWWAMEDAENARRMLGHPAIVTGDMGQVLAAYLVDWLPFETEPEPMMETVRLILQPGLLAPEVRADLWRKAARKPAYLIGFLQAQPDALPDPEPARPMAPSVAQRLGALAEEGQSWAVSLLRLYSSAGQTWLKHLALVLAKPSHQDLVTATFEILRRSLSGLRDGDDPGLPLAALVNEAEAFATQRIRRPELAGCLEQHPPLATDLAAMHLLSGLGYSAIRPFLPDPTTQGSLIRRKLAPLLDPVLERIGQLRTTRNPPGSSLTPPPDE